MGSNQTLVHFTPNATCQITEMNTGDSKETDSSSWASIIMAGSHSPFFIGGGDRGKKTGKTLSTFPPKNNCIHTYHHPSLCVLSKKEDFHNRIEAWGHWDHSTSYCWSAKSYRFKLITATVIW